MSARDTHEAASRRGSGLPGPTERRLLLRAVDAIRHRSLALLLVLDDAHVITEPAAIDAIVGLVDRLSSGTRMAIGARSRIPLPHSRWRAAGELFDLDAEHLALDPVESQALLRNWKHRSCR